MMRFGIIIVVFLLLAGAGLYFYSGAFGAPNADAEPEQFIVRQSTRTAETIVKLKADGFIANEAAFAFAFRWKGGSVIAPGGYKISKAMSAWEAAEIFAAEPYMKWVIIPEGLRKEEIAEILARVLGWSGEVKERWIRVDTAPDPDHAEGVYFPDTYLIPIDEAPADVAARLRAKFEEKFAPFAEEALRQNIRWPTLLRVASLVQREAAGKGDMPLIAGVIWNRLLADMRLEIDATLQYARGDAGKGWWAPITPADKRIDSPYNTYMKNGLPPHPIANPGLNAINAVLHSEETKCFYYLHDNAGGIHCAVTYEEHKANIEKYLK